MISLSVTTAAMLYLGLTLAILLGLWAYHHYISLRKKIVIVEHTLRVCEYCHCAYLDAIAKPVTQCPQCHCYNKEM